MLRKLILGAAALFAGLSLASDCDSGPWNAGDINWTGGNGGGAFCETKWKSGIVITGVEVWASDSNVEAIQFYYSDGTTNHQYGVVASGKHHQRMDWDPSKDSIAQVKTWGNGVGTLLGRLQMTTKSGNTLDVGRNTNGQTTYEKPVDSGILLAAFGASGDQIDSLGLIFMRSSVSSITLSNVVFADTPAALNAKMQGIQTVTVDYADHTNDQTGESDTFTFSGNEQRTESKSYSTTATNTFGVSEAIAVSAKAGVEGLVEMTYSSTTTLSYEYSHATTDTSTSTSAQTIAYSIATTLKPGERVYCRATAMYGTYSGAYTGTLNIILADGTTWSFEDDGQMSQVAWSQATSSCQSTPFTGAAPPAAPPMKRAIKFLA